MKNFHDLAAARRSCHDFETGFKVSESQFLAILEAVRYTPSGYNAQPWQFALFQDEARLQELQSICYNQPHVTECGNMVVVLGDIEFGQHEAERIVQEWVEYRNYTEKQAEALQASMLKDRDEWKKREMVIRNASLAAMTFMYAAQDLGLATCPMMGFKQLELRKWLQLEDHQLPIMLIALGKKKKEADDRLPRKNAEDLWRKD